MKRLAVLLTAVLVAVSCRAQEPSPIRLTISAPNRSFRMGERIPLTLALSSSVEGKYQVTLRSYDRSGRIQDEAATVAPAEGWVDPLADYFAAGYIGGGLSSVAPLTATPVTFDLDLNEYVRFDRPGEYTVTIRSGRAFDPEAARAGHRLPPAEGTVRLRIVAADPAWQQATLQSALQRLAAAPSSAPSAQKDRKEALADLRFLATKPAVHELTLRVRDDPGGDSMTAYLGLFGLPPAMREVAVAELRARIADPEFPVNSLVLSALSALRRPQSDHVSRFAPSDRYFLESWQDLLAEVPHKQCEAAAVSAKTLTEQVPEEVSEDERSAIASVVLRSAASLPEQQQQTLLLVQWETIRGPEAIPFLRGAASLPLDDASDRTMPKYARRELKAVALRRWYELEPEQARAAVLAQIGRPVPSLQARDVDFLSDASLPEYEGGWAVALGHAEGWQRAEVLAGLLARFGTGAATAQVQAALAKEELIQSCALRRSLLAYLVRFAPDQAEELLPADLFTRGDASCIADEIARYTRGRPGAAVSRMAVGALSNADLSIATYAAAFVRHYGDESAKAAVVERLRVWSGQPHDAARPWPQFALGTALVKALLAGQGWLASPEDFVRARQACLVPQVCEPVEQLASNAGPPYRIPASPFIRSVTVAQYEVADIDLLADKLRQFPGGTVFHMQLEREPTSDDRAFQTAIQRAMDASGMRLELLPFRKHEFAGN